MNKFNLRSSAFEAITKLKSLLKRFQYKQPCNIISPHQFGPRSEIKTKQNKRKNNNKNSNDMIFHALELTVTGGNLQLIFFSTVFFLCR